MSLSVCKVLIEMPLASRATFILGIVAEVLITAAALGAYIYVSNESQHIKALDLLPLMLGLCINLVTVCLLYFAGYLNVVIYSLPYFLWKFVLLAGAAAFLAFVFSCFTLTKTDGTTTAASDTVLVPITCAFIVLEFIVTSTFAVLVFGVACSPKFRVASAEHHHHHHQLLTLGSQTDEGLLILNKENGAKRYSEAVTQTNSSSL